jgi:hypothetical protein
MSSSTVLTRYRDETWAAPCGPPLFLDSSTEPMPEGGTK